jgi:hypothetical protein
MMQQQSNTDRMNNMLKRIAKYRPKNLSKCSTPRLIRWHNELTTQTNQDNQRIHNIYLAKMMQILQKRMGN